ncbi:TPA: hypothetical protein QCY29_005226 [Bacillus toyonensis]|nr:hypothetical protein [Bacillus toyonensis]
MSTKVTMITLEGEEKNIPVNRMKVKQFKKALKKINEIVDMFKKNEATEGLVEYFMEMEGSEGATAEKKQLDDKIFIENVMNAMNVLFDEVPDEATELLAIITGIDEDLIDEQEYMILFDLIDAVIEENDLKTLVERAKSTFTAARQKFGGMVKDKLQLQKA